MIAFAFSCDDIGGGDDVGPGSPELFEELLDFLKLHEVQATFFVVPKALGIPLYEKPEWIAVLNRAMGEGHDLELHGLRHNAFEWGIPPDFVLAYEHEARARLASQRGELEERWTPTALQSKLDEALSIFQRSLGYTPTGFRTPWLSTCPALFPALASVGLRFDSSLAVNPTGWHYIREDYRANIWLPVPCKPHGVHEGLTEIPILCEYTWHIGEDKVERHLALALEDLHRVRERQGVFVPLSHYYATTGQYAAGLRVYEALLRRARKLPELSIMTMRDLYQNALQRRGTTMLESSIKQKILAIVEAHQPVTVAGIVTILATQDCIELPPEEVSRYLTKMRGDYPKRIARSADRYSVVDLGD